MMEGREEEMRRDGRRWGLGWRDGREREKKETGTWATWELDAEGGEPPRPKGERERERL